MPHPIPSNEIQRQRALDALAIPDTAEDPFFEGMTALASQLLRTPMAAISFIDRDREWFKAAKGIGIREVPRAVSFCAHAICETGTLAVSDASADARFAGNPLVTSKPHIRSFASAPLIDGSGHALGALCVLDHVPRNWSREEREIILSLSQMTARHLDVVSQTVRAVAVESLHENVLSAMAEGVVVQTAKGEVRLANPAALSILGLTLDQIQGKTSLDIGWQSLREDGTPFPGEDHPAMVTLRTGQSVDGAIMNVARPDGSRKWIKINARPVFGLDKSRPVEVVATFTDLTEERLVREDLQTERRKLAMALDLGAIGVIERNDRTLKITTYGHTETLDRFGAATGKTGEGLIDRLDPKLRADVMEAWMRHLDGAPRLRFEALAQTESGDSRWTLFGAEKLSDTSGRHSGVLVAMTDIHERKTAALELEESLRQLDVASRAKDVFLANIGHEIRTPLNGVVGMASALAMTPLTAEQRDMTGLITSSGEVLERLLNDLLDMAKLDAGKVALDSEPFDLCAAVVEASQLFEIRAGEKGLKFSLELAPEASGIWTGDKIRIKQIVSNLVSNAIKFTSKGHVKVRLSATGAFGVQGPDWATLEIEDTGCGVPEDMHERIFDRFEQLRTPASGQSGTGLGLSICKSLVSLMGGEMSLSSQPGLGSAFTVRLPLTRAATPQQSETAAIEPDTSKRKLMRVLLVDDHPTNQRVIEAMLRAFDCEIVTASDGAEGLAAFQEGQFDLVLMDISMPVMDGLAATRAIRNLERSCASRRTPLAMLTAYGSDQHRREAQDAGADFHIVKPVTPVSLLAGLEKAMRAAKAADAA